MTTKYAPVKPIMAFELFDGRLEEYNVRETVGAMLLTQCDS
jgi:hypothetical protein